MGGVNKTESEGNYTRITSSLGKIHHACRDGIKKFFRNLIEKLSAFIRKTASLVLRTVHYSAWKDTKLELQTFERQIQTLNSQMDCLSKKCNNDPQASAALDAILQIEKKVAGGVKIYLDKMDKINVGAEKSLGMLIPDGWMLSREKPYIKDRKKWAQDCIASFGRQMEVLDRISNKQLKLEKEIIEKQKGSPHDYNEYETNSRNLRARKEDAQKYYDEYLRGTSEKFEGWIRPNGIGISHDIYKEEIEYVAGLKKLMRFERKNIERLRNGEPSALNLMAESRIVLRDRDMTLYRKNFDKIPKELLELKIKAIKKEMQDATTAMQTFKREAEERFKVDDIPYLE